MLAQRVGKNVRRIRTEAGMSQRIYAKTIGMSVSYLGHIERGEQNLRLRTLERLAERMDVPTIDLIRP